MVYDVSEDNAFLMLVNKKTQILAGKNILSPSRYFYGYTIVNNVSKIIREINDE